MRNRAFEGRMLPGVNPYKEGFEEVSELAERRPLYEMTRKLSATARGKEPAGLIVRNGTLVEVIPAS